MLVTIESHHLALQVWSTVYSELYVYAATEKDLKMKACQLLSLCIVYTRCHKNKQANKH